MQGILDHVGDRLGEQLCGSAAENPATTGGEAGDEADDRDKFGDLTAGAGEDLLSGRIDVEQSGFAGAGVLTGIAAGLGECGGEEGFGAGPSRLVGIEVGGESGVLVRDMDREA